MSKTAFGAKWICFTPFAAASAGASIYDTSKMTNIGALQEVTPTVEFVESKQDGDNTITKQHSYFKSGLLDITIDGYNEGVEVNVLGKTQNEDGSIASNIADKPPYGATTFYKTLMDNDGNVYYEGWFYPKTKAKPSLSAVKTAGDTLEFQSEKISMNFFAINDGGWEDHSSFDDEQDCIDWIKKKLGVED